MSLAGAGSRCDWAGEETQRCRRRRSQGTQSSSRSRRLTYSLASDQELYKAARQSRFNNPEIIAVLGDMIRRLRLLKGTRAAIGRKGARSNFHTGCNQLGNSGKL